MSVGQMLVGKMSVGQMVFEKRHGTTHNFFLAFAILMKVRVFHSVCQHFLSLIPSSCHFMVLFICPDILQHNGTQHKDTQHNNSQHKDT
jgi:hypothetical protein